MKFWITIQRTRFILPEPDNWIKKASRMFSRMRKPNKAVVLFAFTIRNSLRVMCYNKNKAYTYSLYYWNIKKRKTLVIQSTQAGD